MDAPERRDECLGSRAATRAARRAWKALTEIADELGQLWLDYTRSAKGSGQFAMGPVKFFGEGWYRRTAAWRDSSTEETQALDGAAFIEEKRRKRANAFAADERR